MSPLPTPTNQLDRKAVAVWRIQALLSWGLLTIGALVAGVVMSGLGLGPLISWAALLFTLAGLLLMLTVVPAWRYRRWRWEVSEQEVRLQKGLLVVERAVIPMVRVQHVDTSQGPIMGAFGLSEVRVWTAAGSHSIPALADEDAQHLRDRIAMLARVTDDGGL